MAFDPVLVWFIFGLVLILAEFMVPGVILVFFGLGAWLASLGGWLGLLDGWASQLLVFAVSSVVLLLALRKRFTARFLGYVGDDNVLDHNLDEFDGQRVLVIEDIDPDLDRGRVEFKGAGWRARSAVPLPAGSRAIIVAVEGIILEVKPE